MRIVLVATLLSACAGTVLAQEKKSEEKAKNILDFTVNDIDGKEVSLDKYRGDVVLIVNVASKCGLTPQYAELQQLHEKYHKRGLRILGFPANNFGGQEPGTNAEIKRFCTSKYDVGFDMFAKVSVQGEPQCALYRFLTSEEKNPKHGGEIRWNFTKFLVDRNGEIIGRFEPRVKPSSREVVNAVENALEADSEKGEKEDSKSTAG